MYKRRHYRMLKNRFIKAVIIFFSITFLFTSCTGKSGKNSQANNMISAGYSEKTADYILTSKQGSIVLCNLAGEIIDRLDLEGSKKSDFLYAIDQGQTFAKSLQNAYIPNILYAADKSNGRLYIIKVTDKKLEKIETKSLKEKGFTKIYGYNGILFYSVNEKGKLFAKKPTILKPEKEKNSGVADFYQTIVVNKDRPLTTYIYVENYSDIYFKETGINNMIESSEKSLLAKTKINKETFEIPCLADDWVANEKYVYFFYKGYMGQLYLEDNKVGLYYGGDTTKKSIYWGGRFKKVLSLNNFGGDNSEKSLLFELDYKNMKINRAIEIEGKSPIDMALDKGNYIAIAMKNDQESEGSYSKIKVLSYKDYSDVTTIPLKYMPSKILAHNGYVYAFNPYEEYFFIGQITSNNMSKYSKVIDNVNYSDILLVDFYKYDDYLYDGNGRYVNENGQLINADNELIDSNNNRINKYGQRLDEYGRAINDKGQLIDRFGNIIDENGKIIEYTKGEDGYYRNKYGQIVDEQGNVLVQNEEGEWVLPKKAEDDIIQGYYDENGRFIIDPSYLKKHPDAYEKLEQQQSKKK